MDYLKVAMRDDLAAEDMSQAAPRAIVHLIGALSRTTFCGKASVQQVAHAGTDRVVSCADCLSFSRSMRKSPADNTSLTEPASRILRRVSGPDYSGIERRRRPRFIHPAVPTTTSNGEETMKKYVNVLRPDDKTVHVMFDGDIATACGAISAPELVPAPQGKAVSCEHCTKAILNQQRVSDRRPPRSSTAITEVQDIINNCNSRMVGDGSGEREYILSVEDIEKLRGLRDAFVAESIIAAQKIVNDADLLAKLHTIVTDPATACVAVYNREDGARIEVIPRHGGVTKMREYLSTSFHQAINVAAEKEIEESQPCIRTIDMSVPQNFGGSPLVSLDAVVEANRKLLLDRSNVGIEKYGVTLEQSGLSVREFAQHALEESLDHANYLQAIIMTLDNQQQKQ